MAYPLALKRRAITLRNKGYSLKEIAEHINVVKSTVSLWVRDVNLDDVAKDRLLTKIKKGQLAAGESKKKKVNDALAIYYQTALNDFGDIELGPEIVKILCAMIYWCEGAKNHYNGVRFTNSDPQLVRMFLALFRKSFDVKEEKFSACIHLHDYHNSRRQLDFWSKVTNIKRSQFINPYHKPNTGKRIRNGYQGCIAIYYYNNDIARQLLMAAKAFLSKDDLTGA